VHSHFLIRVLFAGELQSHLLDTSWGSGHLVKKPCYIVFKRAMDAFFKDCLKQIIEDLLKLFEEGVSTDYED
jgi:hypothetical protein